MRPIKRLAECRSKRRWESCRCFFLSDRVDWRQQPGRWKEKAPHERRPRQGWTRNIEAAVLATKSCCLNGFTHVSCADCAVPTAQPAARSCVPAFASDGMKTGMPQKSQLEDCLPAAGTARGLRADLVMRRDGSDERGKGGQAGEHGSDFGTKDPAGSQASSTRQAESADTREGSSETAARDKKRKSAVCLENRFSWGVGRQSVQAAAEARRNLNHRNCLR
jgi:hypothetical protein